MTIEKLLKLAQSACYLMDTEMGRDRGLLDRAALYGVIAQGYALTAQAMMNFESFQQWREDQAERDATDQRDYIRSQ